MSLLLQSIVHAGADDAEAVATVLRDATLSGESAMDAIAGRLTVDEAALQWELAQKLGCQWTPSPLPDSSQGGELKRVFPARLALRHRVLPLRLERVDADAGGTENLPALVPMGSGVGEQVLVVACYDPFDLMARQAVARVVPMTTVWTLAPRDEVLRGIQAFYGVGADTFDDLLRNRDLDEDDLHLRDEANVIDAADDAEASVVKFVNQIIREALSQRATDIHVEPLRDNLRIRYRVDGELHEASVPENIKTLQASLLARIKVMAKLDIAEKRLPQDGRINLKLDGHSIDVRVACIPSVEGESISLRLLGQERFTLDKLGLTPEYRAKVDTLLAKPNGIVLVTGPTGSGKSTTLYTFLSQLNKVNRRIVTIEDPVEHKLDGVVQIAVKPEINLTFASGLRSILRGDPNVVMVGEIRDLETAEIAVRASLTGHLVFSTLHTNDAIGGITRLVEMGVEPFLVSSSVRAFLAQRLVRSLCPHCKEPAHYSREQLTACNFSEGIGSTLFGASVGGCQACRSTGYYGRLAIYEIVMVTTPMQDLISRKASSNEMMRQARRDGYVSMREYGWRKVLDGITTVEEVMRVTSEDFFE
ncbi:type II/IV secretion system protein [Phragmitibacter flavus]|uniref:Type II/IV secretion system protein n=1 Tax=Phragmitibacter flavus TaxID=2576071 RepID=A0A5R8KIP2_9BACT|nr:GspE/PulE family protein [Phragmitibacter flavus]TLD72183.1 type II/IV secretion system protein [Phragmitibacter flavus]